MDARIASVLALLVLAGCSGGETGGGDPTDSSTQATPSGPSGSTTTSPPGPKPSPVDISDGGDMLMGVDADWEWVVHDGFVNHTVEISMEASNGAPLVIMECVYARLEHGGASVDAGNEANGPVCTAQTTQQPGCFLCLSGLADGIGAGNYTLHFEAAQGSVGRYTVEIHTSY